MALEQTPEDAETEETFNIDGMNAGEVREESFEESATGMNKRDKRLPIDHAGNEVENGPAVDPDDPNLSEVMTEAGAQEDRASLGMRGEDEMMLDDPEEEEE